MVKSAGMLAMASVISFAVVVLAVSTAPADAAPVVFFGEDTEVGAASEIPNSRAAEAAFRSHLVVSGMQSFDGFGPGVSFPSALDFPGTDVTALPAGSGWVTDPPNDGTLSGSGRFPISGTHYYRSNGALILAFDVPIAAFGLFVLDYGEGSFFRVKVERAPGVFEIFEPSHAYLNGGEWLASAVLFFGIIDAENPFTKIVLVNDYSGVWGDADIDGFAYDDIIVATSAGLRDNTMTVSEPSVLSLMGLGLAIVAFARRRGGARPPVSALSLARAYRNGKGRPISRPFYCG